MSLKWPYKVGDIILNIEANVIFCIDKITKKNIHFYCTRSLRTYEMEKLKFKEQIESELGKQVLIYYKI